MSPPIERDSLLDSFIGCFTDGSARLIINFQIAPEVQERVGVLTTKADEGTLSEIEHGELVALIETTALIDVLKLKAQLRLAPGNFVVS